MSRIQIVSLLISLLAVVYFFTPQYIPGWVYTPTQSGFEFRNLNFLEPPFTCPQGYIRTGLFQCSLIDPEENVTRFEEMNE